MIDLVVMNPSNPRCFWRLGRYNGHSVLDIICNQKFIQYIMKDKSFDDILSLDIEEVKTSI